MAEGPAPYQLGASHRFPFGAKTKGWSPDLCVYGIEQDSVLRS
jgi:hypothetical protein